MAFRSKKKRQELESEIGHLESLTLPELAAHVMERAWGPESPPELRGEDGRMNPLMVLAAVCRPLVPDAAARGRLERLRDEALAALERAGLLLTDYYGGSGQPQRWRPSQAGIEALEQGTVVRLVADASPEGARPPDHGT